MCRVGVGQEHSLVLILCDPEVAPSLDELDGRTSKPPPLPELFPRLGFRSILCFGLGCNDRTDPLVSQSCCTFIS